jgi:cellulose synthase/poly-beta-1,6-N-acetylglucosamine synthase-like glycosyltransferase
MPPGSSFSELPALVDPRVSIVVNNHNYGRFLEQAIESAVKQSIPCQVVVVDDGSSDESDAVLVRWEGRVRVERRPHAGQPAAYNAGFACCDGDIVIFLDSDDYLAPEAAAQVAKCFGAGVAKVHFRLSLVDTAGQALGGTTPSVLARGDAGRQLMRSGLLYASAPGSGNAYRRSVLTQLFPLPVSAHDPVGADFFTIYGSALLGLVGAIELPLAAYRVHAAGPEIDAGFVFGNAAQSDAEVARRAQRRATFRAWIADRTGGAVRLPEQLKDFSEVKATFVRALTEHHGWTRFARGALTLPPLLETLWLQSERSVALRAGLSVWGLLVLALPRRVATPLVRYGANPAARRPLRSVLSRAKAGTRAA